MTEVVVKVKAEELAYKFTGSDLEFYVREDGALVVFNYDLRKADPNSSGQILAAAPGEWQYARMVNATPPRSGESITPEDRE